MTPERATELAMSGEMPHAEIVAKLPSDVAWNAGARRFEKIKIRTDVTPTDLAAAGLTEPVNPIASTPGANRETASSREARKS